MGERTTSCTSELAQKKRVGVSVRAARAAHVRACACPPARGAWRRTLPAPLMVRECPCRPLLLLRRLSHRAASECKLTPMHTTITAPAHRLRMQATDRRRLRRSTRHRARTTAQRPHPSTRQSQRWPRVKAMATNGTCPGATSRPSPRRQRRRRSRCGQCTARGRSGRWKQQSQARASTRVRRRTRELPRTGRQRPLRRGRHLCRRR